MTRAAERVRWLMGLAGLGFWLSGFWILSAGSGARWRWRCGDSYSGDCFSDHLPILEVVVAPAFVLLLAYPLTRYIFTMWAPAPEARSLRWWPASRSGHGELLWPFGQLLAAIGIFTSLWALLVFPLAVEFWPYYLYWATSALWCALTVWIAWPQREEAAA